MSTLARDLPRLIAAQISIHAGMTGLRMATPLLALSQGHSPAAVGVLLALFALTQVFFGLARWQLCRSPWAAPPGGLECGRGHGGHRLGRAVADFSGVVPGRLVYRRGSGHGLDCLAAPCGRSAHDQVQLRKVFSWLALGPAISDFLGPFAAGLLIDHAGGQAGSELGFRAAFLLLALLPLAAWFFLRSVKDLPPVATPAGPAPAAWDLLQDQSFRRLLLMNWALSSCWDVHTFVVPILGHERGLSASVIGSILGGFAIAAMVVRLVLPLLAKHLREWLVVWCAMLGARLLIYAVPADARPVEHWPRARCCWAWCWGRCSRW